MTEIGLTEPDRPFENVRDPKRLRYLIALVEAGGNVLRACKLAGVSPSTPYSRPWRDDKEFQEALVEAKAIAAELLEAEAVRRAFEGVEEPAGWYKGEAGGTVRKYSDVLLIFLLKGAFPDKYKDRVDLRSSSIVANIDWDRVSDEQLLRIKGGESILSVLGGAMQALKPAPTSGDQVREIQRVDSDSDEPESEDDP